MLFYHSKRDRNKKCNGRNQGNIKMKVSSLLDSFLSALKVWVCCYGRKQSNYPESNCSIEWVGLALEYCNICYGVKQVLIGLDNKRLESYVEENAEGSETRSKPQHTLSPKCLHKEESDFLFVHAYNLILPTYFTCCLSVQTSKTCMVS